ncbi:MAG: nucleotidyltransferase domain-containing protein, partial [Waterburya sp.]
MTKTLNKISAIGNLKTANPEIELILCCSRTKLDDYSTNNIKVLLEEKLDWHYLLNIAAKQGVLPLVYYNLNRTFSQQVPVEILAQLHQYFQANIKRNLLITAELIKILKALEAKQIEAITFKGPSLAIKAYGQLALRQFCDLDIFIEEQNSLEVVNLLVSLGYQLPDPIAQLASRPYLAYQEFLESEETQKKYNLAHTQKNIAIDLQWSLTERRINRFFPVNFQHINSNSSSISLAAVKIKQFSAEDMLLYLCFHGSKHCWSELKWICDVAEFIRANPEINWQLVTLRAREWKIERMLSL